MKSKSTPNFNSTFLSTFFNTLPDPRRTTKGNLRHIISDILLLTLTSVLCGLQEFDQMVYFGKKELTWFKKHGSFANGIPSKDTLRRFYQTLDPVAFEKCFSDWVAHLRTTTLSDVIAIDGKTIRGATTKSDGTTTAVHILSALATNQGLCLGQTRVNEKSNEITAIPQLLDLLSIEGDTITIDAMGCQKAIATKIIEKQANYVLAVKENQKSLYNAIQETISQEEPDSIAIHDDFGHGRVEKRTCKVFTNLSHFEGIKQWNGLASFVEITSEVYQKATQTSSTHKRIYISSLNTMAAEFNTIIRSHWAIENKLHWVLDVVFNEDASRKKEGNSAENLNKIFKIALHLINKEETFKKSKKNKKLKALLDEQYREKVLGF